MQRTSDAVHSVLEDAPSFKIGVFGPCAMLMSAYKRVQEDKHS